MLERTFKREKIKVLDNIDHLKTQISRTHFIMETIYSSTQRNLNHWQNSLLNGKEH